MIIDPGQDAAAGLRELLAENQLRPKGLLATHGHFDHIASAAEIADEFNVPLWIHSADRHLLTEPGGRPQPRRRCHAEEAAADPDGRAGAGGGTRLGHRAEPRRLKFSVTHAPGHTGGSVLLGLDYNRRQHPQINRLVFTGDVVFAGSVGRTDLPGGDPKVMSQTLSDVVLALPDTARAAARPRLPDHHGPRARWRTPTCKLRRLRN